MNKYLAIIILVGLVSGCVSRAKYQRLEALAWEVALNLNACRLENSTYKFKSQLKDLDNFQSEMMRDIDKAVEEAMKEMEAEAEERERRSRGSNRYDPWKDGTLPHFTDKCLPGCKVNHSTMGSHRP